MTDHDRPPFGDIEDDDVYDADPTIAPEQVTYRLHDLRVALDELAGGDNVPSWDDLDDAEQELAHAIGEVVVAWIAEREPDNPERIARQLHAVRVYLTRGAVPDWDDLTDDERSLAVKVIELVVAWLEREGPR